MASERVKKGDNQLSILDRLVVLSLPALTYHDYILLHSRQPPTHGSARTSLQGCRRSSSLLFMVGKSVSFWVVISISVVLSIPR